MRGVVYVYRCTSTCTQVSRLQTSDAKNYYHFGARLALSDEVVFASTIHAAVYVFHCPEQSACVQTDKLTASDAKGDDSFGYVLAVSWPILIVSAPNQHGSGSVYVFECTVSTCAMLAKFKAAVQRIYHRFGDALATSRSRVFVGVPAEAAAYVFDRVLPDIWVQTAKWTVDEESKKNFGHALAVLDNAVAVGVGATDAGNSIVHIFGPRQPHDGALQQTVTGTSRPVVPSQWCL